MRRLSDFQTFKPEFFENLKLAVVSEKNKQDRKTITVIILEDNNTYSDDSKSLNLYQKFYINVLNTNFKEFSFKEGQPFLMDYLEPGYHSVVWRGDYGSNLSITGFLKV
jgi:hypothetical protein